MEAAAITFLLLFAAFAVVCGVMTVRAVRAVRRGAERASLQARRVIEDTALKARRHTAGGTAGELARLRLELRTAIDSTHRALHGGAAADPSVGEAAALLSRLDEHANRLDGELKLLEREPDGARVAGRLPELAERAQRITHSANSLRWAVQDRARQCADDDLTALNRQIEIEAEALRHWIPAAPAGRVAAPEPVEPPTVGVRHGTRAFSVRGADRAQDPGPLRKGRPTT